MHESGSESYGAFAGFLRLSIDQIRQVRLREPATELAIYAMQTDALRELGELIPEAYVAFLRITNGIQINGAYFKEAENLVLETAETRHPELILLGDEGNTVWHVFDKCDRRFHTINLGYPDESFEIYDSFCEMLVGVMSDQHMLRKLVE